ncbi:hypothetical protein [Flavobacterium sp.]|uniref:hypothetical protein n=1 Tax=Flavobacterium sp. TaxID=239 RepID=UPI0028BDE591|nr:hypothetical protein [Flavobacterium sp.]
MKKKLEAELISIAHRILKLKGKEDVVLLHQETQKLYEKLSILRFYEENFEALKPTLSHEELDEKLEEVYNQPIAAVAHKAEEVVIAASETKPEEQVAEETNEEVALPVEEEKVLVGEVAIDEEDIDEEEPIAVLEDNKEEIIEPLFEPVAEEEKQPQQISFEDLLGETYTEPEFVKVDDVPANIEKVTDIIFEKAETEVEEVKKAEPINNIQEEIAKEKENYKVANLNLNDKFSKTITLGLNDRISFEKHLFDGSGEDLNRVISQLNTLNSLDEAKDFIDDLVKPDYNNWNGKDEYVERFMELVEKRFV